MKEFKPLTKDEVARMRRGMTEEQVTRALDEIEFWRAHIAAIKDVDVGGELTNIYVITSGKLAVSSEDIAEARRNFIPFI